jgi:glycosyltransferase involved in cell wall biosynthesis
MVEHLGDRLDFRIIASDRDSFENRPFSGVEVNAWNRVGAASVFYASSEFMQVGNIVGLLRETPHDVLYLNSFLDPKFTVVPLWAFRFSRVTTKHVVLAPRGEFSPGASAIRSQKKRLYVAVVKLLGLYRNLTWQASSEYEAADIRRVMGRTAQSIVVASNLSPAAENTKASIEVLRHLDGAPLRLVFLSRVSPMKNLDFALRVLRRVRVPVLFDIYGIVDDENYWQHCKEQIDKMPRNVTVQYHGVVEHDRVATILLDHDLLLLPTRGENYGHVIYESLAAGTPALISDQTPWRNLDEAGVGWVRGLDDVEAFVKVIEGVAALGNEPRRLQRERARLYASRVTTNRDTVERNLALFAQPQDAAARI